MVMSNNLIDNNSFEFKDADPIMLSVAESVFNAKIKVGTYTGDNEASQIINLGGKPKAVIIMADGYITYNTDSGQDFILGGIVYDGGDLEYNSNPLAQIVDNGVKVYKLYDTVSVRANLNGSSYTYRYIAFM